MTNLTLTDVSNLATPTDYPPINLNALDKIGIFMSQLTDVGSVCWGVKLIVEAFENSTLIPTTIGQRISKFKTAYKKNLVDGHPRELVKVGIKEYPNGIAYNLLGEYVETIKEKTPSVKPVKTRKKEPVQEISMVKLVAKIKELLTSERYENLAIGLSLATGVRMSEVLRGDFFNPSLNLIDFVGVVKKRKEEKEVYSKPTIVDAQMVFDAAKKLKNQYGYLFHGLTPEDINNNYHSQLNIYIHKDDFLGKIKGVTYHKTRHLYSGMLFASYPGSTKDKIEYCSKALSQDSENESLHYQIYNITDLVPIDTDALDLRFVGVQEGVTPPPVPPTLVQEVVQEDVTPKTFTFTPVVKKELPTPPVPPTPAVKVDQVELMVKKIIESIILHNNLQDTIDTSLAITIRMVGELIDLIRGQKLNQVRLTNLLMDPDLIPIIDEVNEQWPFYTKEVGRGLTVPTNRHLRGSNLEMAKKSVVEIYRSLSI